jgi:hypothetical protein
MAASTLPVVVAPIVSPLQNPSQPFSFKTRIYNLSTRSHIRLVGASDCVDYSTATAEGRQWPGLSEHHEFTARKDYHPDCPSPSFFVRFKMDETK